jgi:acyl-CoA thioester hydrolase
MKSTINFRVRYQETDKMGIVHHSVYLIWFEMGRTEWLRQHGFTYRECEEKGWLLPVVESGVKYLNSARYDDLISIETIYIPEKGADFRFEYIARLENEGPILATGFTRHVCLANNNRIDKEATKQLKAIMN